MESWFKGDKWLQILNPVTLTPLHLAEMKFFLKTLQDLTRPSRWRMNAVADLVKVR